jgi:transcriptional regulator with XRE-family HTH domain
MVAISNLRMARLQKGWTLDEMFLQSKGQLSPARLSRIEREFCKPTEKEAQLLTQMLGVMEHVISRARVEGPDAGGAHADSKPGSRGVPHVIAQWCSDQSPECVATERCSRRTSCGKRESV